MSARHEPQFLNLAEGARFPLSILGSLPEGGAMEDQGCSLQYRYCTFTDSWVRRKSLGATVAWLRVYCSSGVRVQRAFRR